MQLAKLSHPPVRVFCMRHHQLELISAPNPGWRLDDDTKRIGREGIRNARKALKEARPLTDSETDQPKAA